MVYQITPYTLKRAAEIDLIVYPSDKKKYKLEVYNKITGQFLFYAGDANYRDYPSYLETHGKEFAETRRRLYYKRHAKGINNIGSKESIVAYLLW